MKTICALSALIVGAAAPAYASPETEAFVAGVTSHFGGEQDKATAALLNNCDLPVVARFMLGKHARTLNKVDVHRFQDEFATLVMDTMNAHSEHFTAGTTVVIGSHDRNDRESIVLTEVSQLGDDAEPVQWRLLKRDGSWRVVDMNVSGQWLAALHREQIMAILERDGATVDDVLAALRRDDDETDNG